MSLPGGAADKAGNRYEMHWTVFCMTQILAEEAASIWLEPPGNAGQGVEFVLNTGLCDEGHQVKRQHSGLGHWSLSAMEQEQVLSNFWNKLRNPVYHCVFVSAYAADELESLVERANNAQDFRQFQQEFLKANKVAGNFTRLRKIWQECSEEEAYDVLQRVHVRTVDEETLCNIIHGKLATLVDDDPAKAYNALMLLAPNRIHQKLRAYDIWQYLEEQGLSQRSWNNDPHTLAAIESANSRYVDPLRRDAVSDTVISRHEVAAVLKVLTQEDGKRDVLLSGQAGTGKSCVGFQVVQEVQRLGWPVLALRIDRLETMLSPKDVGRQMELRESPVIILANVAQEQNCLLLIDQLDAVSKVSGRNPHFFDCIGELIKQAKAFPKMRLVLLCRKFDIDNDDRLRQLSGEHGNAIEIQVGKLSEDIIRLTVENLGIDATRLTAKQIEVLSIPLHLKLLSEISRNGRNGFLDFEIAQDIYDRYWEDKQNVLRQRRGQVVQWNKVVDTLCDFMSDRQILSAPKDVVADYRQDALDMVSEHVLVEDGKRYAFFHETFFDYAFARRFVARGHNLRSLLLDNEQHLFRRAQVRQILLHERENDWQQYLADLKFLVSSNDVRFHIKQVVFALLGQLPLPTQNEWNILSGCLNTTDDALDKEARKVLCTLPWFQLIEKCGTVQKWLENPDQTLVSEGFHLLSIVGREEPGKVVKIIETYLSKNFKWDMRIANVLNSIAFHKSREALDLFLRLLNDGKLDEVVTPFTPHGLHSLYQLPEKQPGWSCEMFGRSFERRLQLCLERGGNDPFDKDTGTILEQSNNNALRQSAIGAPGAFVSNILPFVLRVLELTAVRHGEPPWPDSVWPYRHIGHNYSLKGELLDALEEALRLLAVQNPDDFVHYAEQLWSSDYETAQFLLIRSYEANGVRFANEAADYLCENPDRLHTGYVDNGYWATRQLLDSITPHCSVTRLRHLENVILNYYSSWEKSASAYHKWYGTARGNAQLTLLNGIHSDRRSEQATRRLEEWRRKFRRQDDKPSSGIVGGIVGSPIAGNAIEKMTDKQWLKAIAKHNTESGLSNNVFSLIGGAHQLSGMLQGKVKQEPERFAKLVLQFPDESHPFYFDAVLRGLREAQVEIDTESLLIVCRRCHQVPGHPSGQWICSLVEKIAERSLPDEILNLVCWYATQIFHPSEELGEKDAEKETSYSGRYLDSDGLNSDRGSAALAMATLLYADNARAAFFLPIVENMLQDATLAVRACVAEVLTALLNYDRDLSVSLFLRLCNNVDDTLFTSRHIERFLYYGSQTHFCTLRPILERELESDNVDVVNSGARLICLEALLSEEAVPLAQICLNGNNSQRKAAAQIFAANIATASNRALCEEGLTKLFYDSTDEVSEEAASCFRLFKDDQIGDYTQLVEAFVASPTFSKKSFFLLQALKETTAKLPEITCEVCETFLEMAGSDAGDPRTGTAADANTIGELAIRVYTQSNNTDIQRRCLNILDSMLKLGTYGIYQELSHFDR
jgi:hypothetical protein